MNFTIRQALTQDANEIARVHIQAWRETYLGLVPQDFLDSLDQERATRRDLWARIARDENKALFVAEVDGQIVGFSAWGFPPRDPENPEQGELGALYLLKEFQGKKIGWHLFQKGIQELQAKKVKKMFCWITQGNPTKKFYEKTKGQPTGQTREDKVGTQITIDERYEWNLADQ